MIRQNCLSVFQFAEERVVGATVPRRFWRLATRLAKYSLPVMFLAILIMMAPPESLASPTWAISVTVAPPPLIVYEQPFCPGPGYIWAPGYWSWGPEGYFWVPGTWVLAPYQGALWTP